MLGSECLDRRSSHRAWIGDRESGLALVADRRAWIGILLAVLGSEFFSPCLDRRQREWIESSSRHRAPCLDRRQREWIGVLLDAVLPARIGDREWIGKRNSRTESREWRERETLVSGDWRDWVWRDRVWRDNPEGER
uniref:Uncharacterized protein n=1 Tax=Quercus lobata TaxID=97700 RepID=A0A7N2LIX7_QUELO